jgi:hypothetical protein
VGIVDVGENKEDVLAVLTAADPDAADPNAVDAVVAVDMPFLLGKDE